MTPDDRLSGLVERLENFLRVLESARRCESKSISVWSGDVEVVAESVAALRLSASLLDGLGQTIVQQETHATKPSPSRAEDSATETAFAKRCYAMSEPHLSGYRLIIGFTSLADAQDAQQALANLPKGKL